MIKISTTKEIFKIIKYLFKEKVEIFFTITVFIITKINLTEYCNSTEDGEIPTNDAIIQITADNTKK